MTISIGEAKGYLRNRTLFLVSPLMKNHRIAEPIAAARHASQTGIFFCGTAAQAVLFVHQKNHPKKGVKAAFIQLKKRDRCPIRGTRSLRCLRCAIHSPSPPYHCPVLCTPLSNLGKVTVNRLPQFTLLSASIVPPWALTMDLAIVSPMPAPPV